jgi:methylmalonyl-CoA/ethylmalonyl-CoA epimerase
MSNVHPVLELRIAYTVQDFERAVKFYCDGLGIEPAAIWNNGEGHALVLDMGRATLELFDEAQAETIDSLEAGNRVSGQIRFALQVPDLHAAMDKLLAHGATLVHPPVMTPVGRLQRATPGSRWDADYAVSVRERSILIFTT